MPGGGSGAFTPEQDSESTPMEPPGQATPQPSQAGPERWNRPSIAALVLGLLPIGFFLMLMAFDLEDAGGIWVGGGLVSAVLAIIFGAIGMSQTRQDASQKGRGLAIAGLVFGILGVATAVIIFIIIVVLIAACISACGGAGLNRGGRPQARDWWTAHHPACAEWEQDVLHVAGVRLCLGCTVTPVTFLATWGVLVVLNPVGAWMGLASMAVPLLLLHMFSMAGATRTRGAKALVKGSLGTGLALLLFALGAMPGPLVLRASVFAAVMGLGALSTLPRSRRLAAAS